LGIKVRRQMGGGGYVSGRGGRKIAEGKMRYLNNGVRHPRGTGGEYTTTTTGGEIVYF